MFLGVQPCSFEQGIIANKLHSLGHYTQYLEKTKFYAIHRVGIVERVEQWTSTGVFEAPADPRKSDVFEDPTRSSCNIAQNHPVGSAGLVPVGVNLGLDR